MTKILRNLYRFVVEKMPSLERTARRVYERKFVDTISNNIYGGKNVIRHDGSILTSVTFDIKGEGNNIVIEPGCILCGVVFYIRGNNHTITIGRECRFNRGGSLWFEDNNCSLIIGKRCTFEDVHIAVTEPGSRVFIGADCMFAYDIDVRTGDSHSIMSTETKKRINYAQDVLIGNHVWIAAHSILLKGVYISDHSVVATGSVVSKQFKKEGCLIAGNPARIVKEQITWSRNRTYETNK